MSRKLMPKLPAPFPMTISPLPRFLFILYNGLYHLDILYNYYLIRFKRPRKLKYIQSILPFVGGS